MVRLLIIVGVMLMPAVPAAMAQHEKEQGAAKGHAADAHGSQANDTPHIFTPVRIDLFIWTLLVFLTLLYLMKRFAWGPILDGLHKREDAIRSAVEEAKLARLETERQRAEFQRKLDEAFAKIPEMMDEARRDAQHMAEEMRTKAQAEIQADRQRLRREIEMARDQALQEIWNQAARLATAVSAKAIKRNISEDDHRRLVDEALTEMRQTGNGRR